MNKPELIIALQAVAESKGVDLSWLDVDVEFWWREYKYRVAVNGCLELAPTGEWVELCNAHIVFKMLKYVEEIKPVHRYTQAEAERAKKDMECSAGFKFVARDTDGRMEIWESKHKYDEAHGEWWYGGNGTSIPESLYPSLKPGTKERLEVIAGCGE